MMLLISLRVSSFLEMSVQPTADKASTNTETATEPITECWPQIAPLRRFDLGKLPQTLLA